jgi:hypothetical protein
VIEECSIPIVHLPGLYRFFYHSLYPRCEADTYEVSERKRYTNKGIRAPNTAGRAGAVVCVD